MAQQPTYLLTPNFTFKPRTGPISLGNLIADPFRPHRVLTTIDAASLAARYPRVEEAIEYERTVVRADGHDVAVSVWAQFLQTVSARLSAEREMRTATEYTMESLVTEYFICDPEQAEIEMRVAEPKVRAVMKASGLGFRQPVYMITGLKIAKGFAGKREVGSRTAGAIEGSGVLAPGVAGDVSIGASVSGGVKSEERDEWKAGGDIVFAYQLLKIKLSGWKKKTLTIDEFRPKSAYLGLDDDSDEDDEDEDEGNDEVAANVATTADLNAADEDKLTTTVVIGDGDSKISVISFPDQD